MEKRNIIMNYLNETDLVYHIRLSKGKGQPTKELETMLIKLGNKFINTKYYTQYKYREDCIQYGLLSLFKNWRSYNEKKYEKALPYLSEIFKRGIALGYNELENISWRKEQIKTVSIEKYLEN